MPSTFKVFKFLRRGFGIFHAPPLICKKLSLFLFYQLLSKRAFLIKEEGLISTITSFFMRKKRSFFTGRDSPLDPRKKGSRTVQSLYSHQRSSLSERGLSLTGVLVASSLSVVVAMGVTKLSTHLAGVSKRASIQFEMIDISNEIRTHLREEASCVKTFRNVKIQGQVLSPVSSSPPPSPLIPSIFDKEGGTVYKEGCYEKGVDETPCRKGNIKFVEFKPLPPETDTSSSFLLDLIISLGHREGEKVSLRRHYPIKVLVSELDTSGKVKRCKALGRAGEEALDTCDPLREGAVKFDVSGSSFEYCDGTGWRRPASTPSKIRDCRGIPYHSEFEKCCFSQRVVKRKTESCSTPEPPTNYCSGVAYNSNTYKCCTGGVGVRRKTESCTSTPTVDPITSFIKTCGSQKYFEKTEKCCGGSVGVRRIGESCTVVSATPPPTPPPRYTPPSPRPQPSVSYCFGIAYNSSTHQCCSSCGKIARNGGNCRGLCGDGK